MANMARVKVEIRGTRPLLQHRFGPDAIPLEKEERTGVAGNDPAEWRKTMMVKDGQLYILPTYVFSCLRDAAKHTKKGRGSIQGAVAATLQIEDDIILITNRRLPDGDPPTGPGSEVYIDVAGVKNPATKARNVRYRLAAAKGWECSFTLLWDRTIVSRELMRAVMNDASVLVGLGDGRSIGNGRFEVLAWVEDNAKEPAAAGSVEQPAGDRVETGRRKVRSLQNAVAADGVPH